VGFFDLCFCDIYIFIEQNKMSLIASYPEEYIIDDNIKVRVFEDSYKEQNLYTRKIYSALVTIGKFHEQMTYDSREELDKKINEIIYGQKKETNNYRLNWKKTVVN
jgi:hypothetical protein